MPGRAATASSAVLLVGVGDGSAAGAAQGRRGRRPPRRATAGSIATTLADGADADGLRAFAEAPLLAAYRSHAAARPSRSRWSGVDARRRAGPGRPARRWTAATRHRRRRASRPRPGADTRRWRRHPRGWPSRRQAIAAAPGSTCKVWDDERLRARRLRRGARRRPRARRGRRGWSSCPTPAPAPAARAARRAGRQGHHVRHGRAVAQAARRHGGDEDRHGRRRPPCSRAMTRAAAPRRAGAKVTGARAARREHAGRRSATRPGDVITALRRPHRRGAQHRRRGAAGARRRAGLRRRAAAPRRHRRHRDADRRRDARVSASATARSTRPRPAAATRSRPPASAAASGCGRCRWSTTTATRAGLAGRRPAQHRRPGKGYSGGSIVAALFLREFANRRVQARHRRGRIWTSPVRRAPTATRTRSRRARPASASAPSPLARSRRARLDLGATRRPSTAEIWRSPRGRSPRCAWRSRSQPNSSTARRRPALAHRLRAGGVVHQLGDRGPRARASKPCSSRGVVRDQQTGLAVGDDLGDAADGAGDDGGATGHRLEVDDAERLVDRGADEHGRVRRARRRGRRAAACSRSQTTPDRGRPAGRRRPRSTSAAISGVSGRAGAQHQLRLGGQPAGGARAGAARPFCRVIRPTKTTSGRSGSMPSRSQHVGVGARREQLGVDAVVHDMHPVGVDRRVRRRARRRACRRETAMTASAASIAVRSAHDDSA